MEAKKRCLEAGQKCIPSVQSVRPARPLLNRAKCERPWEYGKYLRIALGSVCVTDFLVSFRCWAPVRSLSSLEAALTLQESASCFGHLAQAVRGKRSLATGFLVPCGFHMVAELPGAATAKAMSRPEQKETGEVFEEANGGQLEASELMAGGPLPITSVAGGYLFHNCLFPVVYNRQHLLLVGCSK